MLINSMLVQSNNCFTDVLSKQQAPTVKSATVESYFKCDFNCGDKAKHWPSKCKIVKSASPKKRRALMLAHKKCFVCMSSHDKLKCPFWDTCLRCAKCGRKHHFSIACVPERAGPKPIGRTRAATNQAGALLATQWCRVAGEEKISVLFDCGANSSIISEDYAIKHKLRVVESQVPFMVELALGKKRKISVKRYEVLLTDEYGQSRSIQALGMPSPVACVGENDTRPAEKALNLPPGCLAGPSEHVQLLLGTDQMELHPVPVRQEKGLRLVRTPFGLAVMGRVETKQS